MAWKSFDLDQKHSKTSIFSRWVTCRSRRSVSSSPQWNDETASPHTRSGWNVAIARLDINRSLPMDQHHNHNPSWKNQLMLPGWLGNPPKYRTNPFPGSISCRKNFSCSASGTPEMPSTPLIFSRDWPSSYRITMNPREIEIVWSSKKENPRSAAPSAQIPESMPRRSLDWSMEVAQGVFPWRKIVKSFRPELAFDSWQSRKSKAPVRRRTTWQD